MSEQLLYSATLVNSALIFLASVITVWYRIEHILFGVGALFTATILAMKLISYHFVNHDLRLALKSENVSDSHFYSDLMYPKNITLSNLIYFWFAPTLCYQPVYPRNDHVSYRYLGKRLLELIFGISMIYFVLEQYTTPTVKNSMKHFDELDLIWLLERVLKLSVSSIYIWLLLFYSYFHAYLNLIAELLRFGDRRFYEPWWNATTIEEYWRLWNRPVHLWIKRHIYVPLRMRGFSSLNSTVTAFSISAIFHEVIVGVPAHAIQTWAFWGILFQIPLIFFTKLIKHYWPHSSIGNYVFWCSFCIFGQPMCVLLYYRAWSTNTKFLFF